jgi:hypothetical protein
MTFGCSTAAAALDSRTKRSLNAGSTASAGAIVLRATTRSSDSCTAR